MIKEQNFLGKIYMDNSSIPEDFLYKEILKPDTFCFITEEYKTAKLIEIDSSYRSIIAELQLQKYCEKAFTLLSNKLIDLGDSCLKIMKNAMNKKFSLPWKLMTILMRVLLLLFDFQGILAVTEYLKEISKIEKFSIESFGKEQDVFIQFFFKNFIESVNIIGEYKTLLLNEKTPKSLENCKFSIIKNLDYLNEFLLEKNINFNYQILEKKILEIYEKIAISWSQKNGIDDKIANKEEDTRSHLEEAKSMTFQDVKLTKQINENTNTKEIVILDNKQKLIKIISAKLSTNNFDEDFLNELLQIISEASINMNDL